MPTKAQLLMRYAKAAMTGNTNTGRKNFKGRTIFQGPRGGLFIRNVKGDKVYRIKSR